MNTLLTARPGESFVVVTRTIHAPRELVFNTVTDPTLLPQWWGPRRFTTSVIRMAVMAGGTWRFLQRDQDGKEYGFHGIYHEVTFPERLVYTMEYEGTSGHVSLNTDEFAEEGGDTIMTSTTLFESVEQRDQKLQWGMADGASEITDRLNELLTGQQVEERKGTSMDMEMKAKKEQDQECITITRTINAPREEVWKLWTDPEQYMCWWGPKDFTSPYARFDLRPGGKYLSCMRGPDGKEYWDTGIYEEISAPKKLVYTDSFADEKGNIVPPSYYDMGSDEPVEMSVQVTLDDIGGKTMLILEHCGVIDGEFLDQAKEGWNQSLDKLEHCLV
ncbi:MAG: SRPBCC domain-containing protein [Acidobacteriaceae bacterium]